MRESLSRLNLTGQLITSAGKTMKSLVTYLPAIELENYLLVDCVHRDLEVVYDAAKNKTNLNKVYEIQDNLRVELLEGQEGVPLALTVVLTGKPKLIAKGGLGSLEYAHTSSVVIGNVLLLMTILKVLGIKAPLFASRLSSSNIRKNSVFRQILAKENVILTVVFDDEKGIGEEQVRELFFKCNQQHTGMHLTQFSKLSNSFPLKPFIVKLAQNLNLESYGGVSTKAKHVKISESYLTTEYILFKFIVGSIAGPHIQENSKMSDDAMLLTGKRVSAVLSNAHVEYIEVFLSAWLQPFEQNSKSMRSGFRLSAQIWQALALVLHQLIIDGSSIEKIMQTGLVLGQLDYSKKAEHWDDCDVMGLDSNGRLYKNAANSTREFRSGLVSYFLRLAACD